MIAGHLVDKNSSSFEANTKLCGDYVSTVKNNQEDFGTKLIIKGYDLASSCGVLLKPCQWNKHVPNSNASRRIKFYNTKFSKHIFPLETCQNISDLIQRVPNPQADSFWSDHPEEKTKKRKKRGDIALWTGSNTHWLNSLSMFFFANKHMEIFSERNSTCYVKKKNFDLQCFRK